MLKRNNLIFAISLGVIILPLVASPLLGATVGDAVLQRQAELESELVKLEREIESQRQLVRQKQQEAVSLERDIAILDAQISKARLEIKARDLAIRKLTEGISAKTTTIGELAEKIAREKESLAEVLRRSQEISSLSVVEIVLSNDNLSDFFDQMDSFNAIQASLQDSFNTIQVIKSETETEKLALEDKRREEQELRTLQEFERKRLEQQESEKQKILKATRGQEAAYQKILASREKDAAAIRAALFNLRGTAAIPFGQAVELAFKVREQTGVRPALLLAVIAEESNLGENVGTGTWTVDMHPTRDRPVFAQLTAELGLDPDKMPVSKKPWYGWGGAMGPAQFIPSTWVLYKDEVAQLTGHKPPNPWDPEDAFMAAGVLLSDNGAISGNYSAERLAALRYFAGWRNATKPAYAFYGDDVMSLAVKYQQQIDILGLR